MKYLVGIFSVLVFIVAVGLLIFSKSAIHEIESFVLFCYSGILFIAASMMDIADQLIKKIDKL